MKWSAKWRLLQVTEKWKINHEHVVSAKLTKLNQDIHMYILLLAGIHIEGRGSSSSVTLHGNICNVTHQGTAHDGGPVVLCPVQVTPCLQQHQWLSALMLPFWWPFCGKPKLAVLLSFSSACSRKELYGINGTGCFYGLNVPSLHPIYSVKALKQIQNTNSTSSLASFFLHVPLDFWCQYQTQYIYTISITQIHN